MGDGIYYLPDFLLHNVVVRYNQGNFIKDLWVEVKGNLTELDKIKINKFYPAPLLVLPNIPDGDLWRFMYEKSYNDFFFNFSTIDGDEYTAYLFLNKQGQLVLVGGDYCDVSIDEKATVKAYELARQARFEHGQFY